MKKDFYEGYKFFSDNVGANLSGALSDKWVDGIEAEVNKMMKEMTDLADERSNSDVEQLKGLISEIWHKNTFNMNAKAHMSSNHAIIPDASEYASSDVSILNKNGEVISKNQLKYYKTAKNSAKELGKSPFEDFMNYNKKNGNDQSYDKFLDERHVDKDYADMSKYFGSSKIVSFDQLDSAKEYAFKKYMTANSSIQSKRWKEVYDSLDSIVRDNKGNKSKQLSIEQAIKLTKAAKEGNLEKEFKELGININELVSYKDIMKQAFNAGLNAAAISMIISIAPCVVDAIIKTLHDDKIDKEDFIKYGLNILNSSSRSFIVGLITAAIVSCCKTGKFGESLINISIPGVSSLVVIFVGTVIAGIKMATGKIAQGEMARELMRLYTTSAFAFAGGSILSVICGGSPFMYLLGSIVGGIVGGFAYKLEEHLIMSLCRNNDCTFFGIVDQNYKIPNEVLDELHLDIFKPEKFEINRFQYKKFNYSEFSYKKYVPKTSIRIMSRDIIDVYKIGYVYK